MTAMRGYPKLYGPVAQTGVVNPAASCQAREEWIEDAESPTQRLLPNTGTPADPAVKCDPSSNSSRCDGQQLEKLTNSLLYGVVNSIRAIPTMYGYAVIIFSHPTFGAFMPALSKLVIFSSAVHQLMFTLLSSLPFAIGQVQDAGLIFLSAMASSICNGLGDDVSPEAKVATTIVTIGLATASLGVCLVVMGRFKLAALAAYLPMPVIGGYLAFIGVFCLYAGLALSTGLVVNDFSSMLHVLDDAHNVLLCVPGFLGGATLLLVSQNFKNPFALSTAIMVMPVLFFLVLAIGSISLDQARDSGWVDPVEKTASVSELLGLFDLGLVHWAQVPKQVVTWLGMVFIVAISSSLDVAAIEIDMGSKLDINHELRTVGWSNVVSGLLGGYTGSYIFGQTIFTCRSKTDSRVVGVCVILAELAIVAVPVSVMSYVPRFFLAATLFFVALDLMLEWLLLAYRKMCVREWAVVWLSFLAINLVSLDVGMLIGVGVAVVNFMLSYVQVPVVNSRADCSSSSYTSSELQLQALTSNTVRTRQRGAIAHFEFSGFLFFGSVVQILEVVQKGVYVRKSTTDAATAATADRQSFLPTRTSPHSVSVECLDGSPALNAHLASPTEFVVMDLGRVSGMDATAARGAFLILKKYCSNRGIAVVFASALPSIRTLLLKNDIAGDESFYDSVEAAIKFCENQLTCNVTADAGTERTSRAIEPASLLLRHFLDESDAPHVLEGVDAFFQQLDAPAGHEFYRAGQLADSFYVVARGHVASSFSSSSTCGGIFGAVSFFAREPRASSARATTASTVHVMTREQFASLQLHLPATSLSLHAALLRSLAVNQRSV